MYLFSEGLSGSYWTSGHRDDAANNFLKWSSTGEDYRSLRGGVLLYQDRIYHHFAIFNYYLLNIYLIKHNWILRQMMTYVHRYWDSP